MERGKKEEMGKDREIGRDGEEGERLSEMGRRGKR